ncbi:MAG: alpha-glucosidase/alpha-galactosidase [Defluviitaleaceae bacterium]|nr:alpha-glucosidase/alpha-galactosidase [Defluviitaleaceae bacterium]
MAKKIKIAYIGGGSKQWARVFMNDLILNDSLNGELALYDIDVDSAIRNKKIGERLCELQEAKSKWDFSVHEEIGTALTGADFIVISILPGTFEEMRSDVHTPEKYGIYQPVGDTAGPGGILRSMRTVPIYEQFAKDIEKYSPDAWVINFTNPMSILVKTLYDVFPKIKAFGCCHEVFNAQDFLTLVLEKVKGIERPDRHDIYTDASGVNHFTWITEATYGDIDILALLPEFEKQYPDGILLRPFRESFLDDHAKVKMDLYKRYDAMGAAGDRHLVEFCNSNFYLKDKDYCKNWGFNLTTVDFRQERQDIRVAESIAMAEGTMPVELKKSSEEAVELMKAIAGQGTIVSNVNMPNIGQMASMPNGSIVETNCIFTHNLVQPIVAKELPTAALNLVHRAGLNIDATYEGIKERDLKKLFATFADQPLCANLDLETAYNLFKEMCMNTKEYLEPFFDLSVL